MLTPLRFCERLKEGAVLERGDVAHALTDDAEGQEEEAVEQVPAEDAVGVDEDFGFVGKALFFVGGMPMRKFMRTCFCRSALPLIPCMA